jgi:hypothetical protein
VWVGMPAYEAMSIHLQRRYVFFKQDERNPRLICYILDSELGTEHPRTVEVLFSATGAGSRTGPMTNAHHTYLHPTTLEKEMARFPEQQLDEQFAAAGQMLLVRPCVCCVCVCVCVGACLSVCVCVCWLSGVYCVYGNRNSRLRSRSWQLLFWNQLPRRSMN